MIWNAARSGWAIRVATPQEMYNGVFPVENATDIIPSLRAACNRLADLLEISFKHTVLPGLMDKDMGSICKIPAKLMKNQRCLNVPGASVFINSVEMSAGPASNNESMDVEVPEILASKVPPTELVISGESCSEVGPVTRRESTRPRFPNRRLSPTTGENEPSGSKRKVRRTRRKRGLDVQPEVEPPNERSRKSPVVGVHWIKGYWVACWTEDRVQASQRFSISEHGDETAHNLAVQLRLEKERLGLAGRSNRGSLNGTSNRDSVNEVLVQQELRPNDQLLSSGHPAVNWVPSSQGWAVDYVMKGMLLKKNFVVSPTVNSDHALRQALDFIEAVELIHGSGTRGQ